MKTAKPLFQRYILRTWTFVMIQSAIALSASLVCAIYFRTWSGIMLFAAFLGILLLQRKVKNTIKKRGCANGILSESDSETYLFRGNDGSELRVPKSSQWIYVERDNNGNAERILYSPVCEFTPEDNKPVSAPDIPSQRPIFPVRKLIAELLAIIAFIILYSWWFGDYFPMNSRIVYRNVCPCTTENDSYQENPADEMPGNTTEESVR